MALKENYKNKKEKNAPKIAPKEYDEFRKIRQNASI